ncbi:MAG: twin-arginine translocation pathway signal [Burkholderiaceae bacterium]
MTTHFARRGLLAAAAALLLAGCASSPAGDSHPPIVFVHGNGDTAALWHTTLWRFESNGWPAERLHAIDLPYPLARDADDKPQDGRTSTMQHMQYLSAQVDEVLRRTGQARVVLMGNSRGGNAIRNYIANGGGAAKVSHAILGGVPNHGVWAHSAFLPNSEFNGTGPFLRAMNNQGGQGGEITPGVRWLTIRSDNFDKFAQPDGVWIGQKGAPTNVSFDGPELKGAENVIIAGIDHRETSFSAKAFAAAHRFITGRESGALAVRTEPRISLSGKVSGTGLDNGAGTGNFANNLALAGAEVEVYAVDATTGERQGATLHRQTVGEDGLWGPLITTSNTALEFQVRAADFAVTHIYRSPFARSSSLVHLRAQRAPPTDRDAGAIVTLTRPRGYFGVPRDRIVLDGKSPPAGIPTGVPGVSVAQVRLPAVPPRTVSGEFNDERIVGRTWPASANHVVLLELHD